MESNPKIVIDLMFSASFGEVATMNIGSHMFVGMKLPRPGCCAPVEQGFSAQKAGCNEENVGIIGAMKGFPSNWIAMVLSIGQ